MPNIERQIADAVLAGSGLTVARLGLRFDRVVVRLLGDLRAYAETAVPAGATVLITHTAPIRQAGKSVAALRPEIQALAARGGGDHAAEINSNAVRLRLVNGGSDHRLVGFVHNPATDPMPLLDLAERWLRR